MNGRPDQRVPSAAGGRQQWRVEDSTVTHTVLFLEPTPPLAGEKGVGVTISGMLYQGFLSLPPPVVLERAEQRLFWPGNLTTWQQAKVLARLERLNELVGRHLAALRRLACAWLGQRESRWTAVT